MRTLLGIILIVFAAFIVYFPALGGGFIWDDELLLTDNPLVKAADGLWRIWCTTEPLDYWPISYTTFWIEWRCWGMNSTGYHVTNLILHIDAAMLIWIILRKLSIPGAFLAALIWAVHPVNVESVAWIAQRKNTLAMCFFLLSVLCYFRSDTDRRPLFYCLSLLAFVVGMLSKGSIAVLPIILLGIVWWRRTGTVPIFASAKMGLSPFVWRWELLQLAPFFLVALVLTGVNLWFQTHGTGEVIRTAGFLERLLGAGGVVWFYLYKTVLPLNLAFIYPQWQIHPGDPLWWLPLLAAVAVTVVLWRHREGWSRPVLFAWGFFCVALIPVLGLTDVYFMKFSLVADHYQHLALIGMIALATAGWAIWHKQLRAPNRWTSSAAAVLVVLILSFLTWRQSGLYRDAITLYKSSLRINPKSWMAHNNLGIELADKGQLPEAFKNFQEALQLKPDCCEAHNNLGQAFAKTNQLPEAIEHYQQAVQIKPDYLDARFNLGTALHQAGRQPEAIVHLQQALQIKPDYAEAHNNLGHALYMTGQYQEAIEHYQAALRLNPNYSQIHYNLARVLAHIGQLPRAMEHFQQALEIQPDQVQIYCNLMVIYAKLKRSSEAMATARQALEMARSQGQTALAKQIEDWLNSYQADLSITPDAIPSGEAPSPPR